MSPKNRLDNYLTLINAVLGDVRRHAPCRTYVTGMMQPLERKSMEPLAALLGDAKRTPSEHSRLQQFVTDSAWDELAVLRVAREYALPWLLRSGGVEVTAIDDTGFPKKGTCSVGVGKQYCGVLGKEENCQVSVSLSLANERMSLPVAWELYLPKDWCSERKRREKVGVPDALEFRAKGEIALDLLRRMQAEQVPLGTVVADAGYGRSTEWRDELTRLGLPYAVGILKETGVAMALDDGLIPADERPARREGSCESLALALPKTAWKSIAWREGSRGTQRSRFALLRVCATRKVPGQTTKRPSEWLVIEWPKGAAAPTKYFLSSLPPQTKPHELIRIIKLRWRIERDYQDLKDDLGIDHFEGRSWRGFHHHIALTIASYAFIAVERARGFPPSEGGDQQPTPFPTGYIPRGSPTHRHRSRP